MDEEKWLNIIAELTDKFESRFEKIENDIGILLANSIGKMNHAAYLKERRERVEK